MVGALVAVPLAAMSVGARPRPPHVGAMALAISSATYHNGARMPYSTVYDRGGCRGPNVSPQLRWRESPRSVLSFALLMHDPDARAPGGWWHWVRFNIPGGIHQLRAGDPRTGTDGTNSFGQRAYGGPCPPPGSGIHHYHLVLYGLNVGRLSATPSTDGPALLRMVHGHTVAAGNLVGTYSR
ncbi:MAG: YbhB/YbcL family Raf kinase inhibitor-like protein [Candidatus Eremiobacteraeota bacterium]|nr:YbhB/YbcL family Raf kinase inhibitor-like protein [Candidatus Eremiobacteraeota bacterium]MBC5802879.1 YbhB/YbcL family Raf kinase inhibitor-like protein [Candidatus Eremiobacteraeota bacterium]MBC5821920.1 YbhB/YbcL family Raf kinase inhibitor-like protein [Candidatus Eremiobacteraeota bacterium]